MLHKMFQWSTVALLVLNLGYLSGQEQRNHLSCADVRRTFSAQGLGPQHTVPAHPMLNPNLSICQSSLPGCCSLPMEKLYQIKVNQQLEKFVFEKFLSLKLELQRFLEDLEDNFVDVIEETKQNFADTVAKHRSLNPRKEQLKFLFSTSMGGNLRLIRNDVITSVEIRKIERKFKRLASYIYLMRYEDQTNEELSPPEEVCVLKQAEALLHPEKIFKNYFKILLKIMSRTSAIAEALNSAINSMTTNRVSIISAECQKSLVKMRFCSQCRLFTEAEPCRGYCLNVISGCLNGVAEVNKYWKYYVKALKKATNQNLLNGDHDVRTSLRNLISPLEALLQRKIQRNTIHSIRETCSLSRNKRSDPDSAHNRDRSRKFERRRSSSGYKITHDRAGGITVIERRNDLARDVIDFQTKVRNFLQFLDRSDVMLDGIPEEICDSPYKGSDAANRNCWNGNQIIESYTDPVAKEGFESQQRNPEMKANEISSSLQEKIENLRISTKMLKLGVDDPIPPALLVKPSYVTLRNNQSRSSNRFSANPCGDDEDECPDDDGSGSNVDDRVTELMTSAVQIPVESEEASDQGKVNILKTQATTDIHSERKATTDIHSERKATTDIHSERKATTDIHSERKATTDIHSERKADKMLQKKPTNSATRVASLLTLWWTLLVGILSWRWILYNGIPLEFN